MQRTIPTLIFLSFFFFRIPFAQKHAFCKCLAFLCLSKNMFLIKSSFSPTVCFPTRVKILVARSEIIVAEKAGMEPMGIYKYECCV